MLIDTPGHKKYFRNTINGVACAEVVVLVVSAFQFENDLPQTREYALLAYAMGC
jgi:translation elongation factor EF-1alpha